MSECLCTYKYILWKTLSETLLDAYGYKLLCDKEISHRYIIHKQFFSIFAINVHTAMLKKNTKSLMHILEYLMSDDILYWYANSVNRKNTLY